MPNPPTPPPGYKLDVNPPSGYILENDFSSVPAFLKQGVDTSRVRQVVTSPAVGEGNAVAKVDSDDPYKIKVLNPGVYDSSILNHELTHTFQDTRSPGLSVASDPFGKYRARTYEYGGVPGLQAARTQGKTISDFTSEQQAEMVKDYKTQHDQYLAKASKGKITPADEKQMYNLQQAYHPFVKQLADMPNAQQDIKRHPLLELLGVEKPDTINTKPEPPGLPSYDTPGLGILPADKLMGGKSQPTTKLKK